MCVSNLGTIQPIEITNCLLFNQVLVNGFRDSGKIPERNYLGPSLHWSFIYYLLKAEEEPQCIPCNASLTIKHVLVDCVDLAPTRQRFFDVDSLTTLFDTVKFESVFDFLKEVHLYEKM